MTAYEKPDLEMGQVEAVIRKHFGPGASEITSLTGGNLSSVFSIVHEGKGYNMRCKCLGGVANGNRIYSSWTWRTS